MQMIKLELKVVKKEQLYSGKMLKVCLQIKQTLLDA